jgi:oligopeptidase A
MSFDRPQETTLQSLEASLQLMLSRLQSLVDGGPLTEDGLIEITAIYNNVAYLFLYLEANDDRIRYEALLSWRAAFHDDSSLTERILDRLLKLRCEHPEVEESRLAYVEQLRSLDRLADTAFDDELKILLAEAKSVIERVRAAEVALLERLGTPVLGARPSALMYQLISSTNSADVREKLSRIWIAQRAGHHSELLRAVDRMVEVRRERSKVRGYQRPVDEILAKCTVGSDAIGSFLQQYMRSAVATHEDLLSKIREVVGERSDLLQHFGYYVRTVVGTFNAPKFSLDDCLSFVFRVAQSVFGLVFERCQAGSDGLITVTVSSSSQTVGEIHFDLWGSDNHTRGNHTRGLRNRTDWRGLRQLPVAHVFCGFHSTKESDMALTFQNVHSLFHEFGHAINHLLIRKCISNRSGLEYLPLERLEYLSMWFEKWVYHRAFTQALSYSERERIQLCQRVKALEYCRTFLERGIIATLDWRIHQCTVGHLEDVFRTLDDSYSLNRQCALDDLLECFTWPMFQANPGANFSYLWGAAFSADRFLFFEPLNLMELSERPGLRRLFDSCFDFESTTQPPSAAALFSFYKGVAEL